MTDILDELNKEPPFEGCHVFFALHLANYPLTEERTQLQDDLNNRLKWRPQGWDKSLSVVFEKDHTVLPIAVSDYFEKLLLEVFPEIAGCLKLFRPGATWDKKTTHLDFERYACSDSIMDSIATYISAMETTTSSLNISEGSDKKIRPDSLLSLARMIKRLVLFPYYEKHSISSDVLQEILVRAQFEEEFAQQIKPSSTSRLLDMKKTTKKLKKLKFSDNDKKTYSDLVKSIIQDVWPLVQKLENEYSKISTICKKMSFEVEHYIEESTFEKKTDWQLKAPVVPQHIRNEILRVKDVYCIGTVYNEFTVYLHQEADKESEEHVHSEIDSIKKRHNSHFEYSIEKVMKPPVALANQQFENGDVIRSPGSAADFRYGTLGSFVKGSDDNIYAITCAHVVSHPDNDLDVFVRERGVDFRLFANSSPDLTVCFGETPYSLIDIAALAIKPDVEQQYEPRLVLL
ncbi:hypothetical protein DPMN_090932 [Dreissena polymorpha]|uniref:Serine protease n=1 Tax=Dreissena polymorpha TaxID=45954 RepID=A0A9D4KYM1_DREPO|nr:hypothetical protein DPMN_090932 [Dreissena polymorpha]